MSVIIENNQGECFVFCKGSPKLIERRSIPETLPEDHQDQVNSICKDGLRLISFGYKKIEKKYVEKITRAQAERDLVFLGFYVMENQLKKETKKTIKTLRESDIKNIMISGDNIYTCTAVSLESGIIGKDNEVFIGEIIFTGEEEDLNTYDHHGQSYQNTNNLELPQRPTFGNKSNFSSNLEPKSDANEFQKSQKMEKDLSDFTKISGTTNMSTFGKRFEFDLLNLFHKGILDKNTDLPLQIENYLTFMTNSFDIKFISIGSKQKKVGKHLKFKEGGIYNKIWTFKDIYEKKDSKIVIGLSSESFIILLCKILKTESNYNIRKNMLQYLAHSCRTYGEVSYEMKKEIIKFIKAYKNSKFLTCYVGDGTNDCEALREADISMALGEFDISIAAPFVSKTKNISSILTLIREGKASLTNGFHNFRFFIFFTTCQFCGLMLLFYFYISWNAAQLIWMDLSMLTVFGYLISSFKPGKLTSDIPKSSLFNKRLMVSLTLQISASLIMLIISYYILRNNGYSFYELPITKFDDKEKQTGHIETERSYCDNHFLFILVNNFFLIYFFIINFRSKFREKLYKKPLTLFYLIFMFGMNIIWLNLSNMHSEFNIFLKKWFEIPPMEGIGTFLAIILTINSLITIIIEVSVEFFDRKYQKSKTEQRKKKCKIFKFINLI
jgi:magnesium-transporting ATPase (P-type)